MENLTLLDKFKNYLVRGDLDFAFIEISKDVNKLFVQKKPPETINKEIVELGDFCFKEGEDIYKEKEIMEKTFLFDLYVKIKEFLNNEESFFDECKDILCSLKINEVREIESLSKLIMKFEGNKMLKISYNDGLIFNYEMTEDFFNDNMNTLNFKSFLARCLKIDGVVIVDFLNSTRNQYKSAGFLFKNSEWFSLRKEFIKNIHKPNNYKNKVEYIVLTKE